MKLWIRIISISIFLLSAQMSYAFTWLMNYEEAVNLAQHTSKPMVLYFTGSDWCGWCQKLEDEVLNTREFSQAVGDKLIFIKLDFPMYTSLPSGLKAQNQQLQEKFSVQSFPTLILLDSEQRQIGITGYRKGGPREYTSHLFKMVEDYTSYQQSMHHLGTYRLSGKDLKRLYQKANELGQKDDANKIVRAGVRSDQRHYFMTERYRFLVDEGQIYDDETKMLRRQLLANDSANKQLTHYQIAVIDFEAYCEEMEKENYAPELAVAPLVVYIDKFGPEDKENLWRLYMVISQVFLDKNKFNKALDYVKASYDTAPTSKKQDIANAIQNIQSKIKP